MGIFRRQDSPYWWYRIQLDGRVVTGSTNTADKKLANRIHLEKHHQFAEEHHLPSRRFSTPRPAGPPTCSVARTGTGCLATAWCATPSARSALNSASYGARRSNS